jgi:pyruvate dehydrogenase E2 component (dihydrolipoamide acetyltransferase)/2-oxoisovalerate dehydrogenase E2 component (dihydrolipoyl transacylase)
VRRIARQLGVSLSQIRGSGPEGRILLDDLPAPGSATQSPSVTPAQAAPGTRVKLRGVRRKIAERMVQSKQTIPHYGYVDECDVTDLVRLRASLKETFAQAGVKLTYLPFFVKAAVAALKKVPLVNASLDDEAAEIVLHDQFHIGIATAAPDGLVVPVIHDADRKSLVQIAREVQSLAESARAGTLSPEQLRGGTFTITSIGSIGGLISMPIINPPQVGILGIGKIVKRPIYDADGALRPADMVYLSFSFDHRIVDGAVGAEFGNAIIEELKSPARMLVESL